MHNSKLRPRFNVRRNGIPIRQYWLRPGINVGISYGRSFVEANACMAAGLDYWKWRNDEYSSEFRAEVVAWYELNHLISSHTEAVKSKALEKQGKKGK